MYLEDKYRLSYSIRLYKFINKVFIHFYIFIKYIKKFIVLFLNKYIPIYCMGYIPRKKGYHKKLLK